MQSHTQLYQARLMSADEAARLIPGGAKASHIPIFATNWHASTLGTVLGSNLLTKNLTQVKQVARK